MSEIDERLPLTNVAFEILLSLAEGDRHGYAILTDVRRRTSGRVNLHPGTLYRAISRLVESGLIEEIEQPPGQSGDERRRYYRMTPEGRRLAEAEARRLADQVEAARSRQLIGGGNP